MTKNIGYCSIVKDFNKLKDTVIKRGELDAKRDETCWMESLSDVLILTSLPCVVQSLWTTS